MAISVDRPSLRPLPDAVRPCLDIPPSRPVTDVMIERRRELFDRAIRLREKIGPIGVSIADLVREGRDGVDDGP